MPRSRLSKSIRNKVAQRGKHRCEYCQSLLAFSTQPFCSEHIIPLEKNGTDDFENLAHACQGCNGHKAIKIEGYDVVSKQTVRLFNPRTQHWKDHFKWSEDFTHIIGLTPSGRITVDILKMNREGLINLRIAVFNLGLHPPKDTV